VSNLIHGVQFILDLTIEEKYTLPTNHILLVGL